jgi:hypothetical protein
MRPLDKQLLHPIYLLEPHNLLYLPQLLSAFPKDNYSNLHFLHNNPQLSPQHPLLLLHMCLPPLLLHLLPKLSLPTAQLQHLKKL